MDSLQKDFNKLVRSFGFAIEGFAFAFRNNQNLQIAFVLGFSVLFFSLILEVTQIELIVLLLTTLLLIGAEMVNTAVEEMVNLIAKDHRVEAKIAKDVAAGMVMLALFGSIIVYSAVLLPYILRLH
jgi:diacylglycerol kinase (ATP)